MLKIWNGEDFRTVAWSVHRLPPTANEAKREKFGPSAGITRFHLTRMPALWKFVDKHHSLFVYLNFLFKKPEVRKTWDSAHNERSRTEILLTSRKTSYAKLFQVLVQKSYFPLTIWIIKRALIQRISIRKRINERLKKNKTLELTLKRNTNLDS